MGLKGIVGYLTSHQLGKRALVFALAVMMAASNILPAVAVAEGAAPEQGEVSYTATVVPAENESSEAVTVTPPATENTGDEVGVAMPVSEQEPASGEEGEATLPVEEETEPVGPTEETEPAEGTEPTEGAEPAEGADPAEEIIPEENPAEETELLDGEGEPEQPLDDLSAAILAKADELFEGNHSQISGQVYRVIKSGESEKLYAGDTVTYEVNYVLNDVPSWVEQYDRGRPFFDTYYNNVFEVRLPAGLILSNVSNTATMELVGDVDPYDPTIPHTYLVHVADNDTQMADKKVQLSVYITGNGTERSIADYNLRYAIAFKTSFDVVNKVTNPYTKLKTYTQSIILSPESIRVDTLDQWGVMKTAESATVDMSAMTATVKYRVKVGLVNLSSGSKQLITDPSLYPSLHGVDELSAIQLVESMTATLGQGGQALTLVGSPTIAKVNGTSRGETVEVGSDPINVSPYSYETNPVALNHAKVDSTGDNHLDQIIGSYTEYEVTAVYRLAEDMIENFNSDASKVYFDNTANLNYTLAKKPQRQDQDDAQIQAQLPTIAPAKLKVDKKLILATNNETDYVTDTKEKYDPISYTLTTKDGSAFNVYTKNSKGEYVPYGLAEGETAKTTYTVTEGTTYYLVAGITYSIAENMTDRQELYMDFVESRSRNLEATPAADASWEPVIYNKETIGTIVVQKKDDHNRALPGAVFAVFNAAGEQLGQNQTTNANGVATFTDIPYGTYTVREISAPAGYAIVQRDYQATLPGENEVTTVTVNATNNQSSAFLTLTKKVGGYGSLVTADASFPGSFTLERRVGDGEWETVATTISGGTIATTLNANGQIDANVDAFDADGNAYTYRFKETIPDGYYDPAHPDADTAYSAEKTLVDEDGKASAATVQFVMENRSKVQVKVNKEFYIANNNKLAKETGKTTNITLYKYDGTTMEAVGTKSSDAATWTGLSTYEGDKSISYYLLEEEVAGYILDTAGLTLENINGTSYIKATTSVDGSTSNTLRNIAQVYPVTVKKANYYTKAHVNGSGFTVKTEDGTVVNDAKASTSLSDVMITASAGKTIYLTAGQKYYITETVNNTGLQQVNATEEEPLEIDLTNARTITYNSGNVSVQTVTIYNKPDPKVIVNKKNSQATSTNVSGAKFTVFQLVDGEYVPYTNASGAQVVISGNGNTRLPVGMYYLAETTVPSGFINPNLNPEEYTAKYPNLGLTTGTYDGQQYLFVPLNVPEISNWSTTTKKDYEVSVTLYNIPNVGSVKVVKNIDGKAATVGGFTINIMNGDTVAGTATTNANGQGLNQVTIGNLPVYDAQGNKIVYTVKEADLTGDNADRYYKVYDGQTVTLTPNTTVTVGSDNATLHVDNATYTSVTLAKSYLHAWEYTFTNVTYTMSGIEIGLYQLSEDGTTYLYQGVAETDASGRVHFDKLLRSQEYVLAEISCPNEYLYPVAADLKTRLEYAPKADFPVADLSRYNARVLPAETADAPRPMETTDLERLWNKDSWVQFDVTKYLDHEPLSATHQSKQQGEIAKGQGGDTKYDGAIYEFYRYVVPDGVTNITFNLNDPGDWELVSTYTTGTEYGTSGDRMPGQFRTDVDRETKGNVVYFLTEKNTGPHGAIINPNFQNVFWQEREQNYTLTIQGGNTRYLDEKYDFDRVNYIDLLNDKVEGEGRGSIMMADIRIAKWMDEYDADGNLTHEYKPLPNATFVVKLGDEELETLTVGLDNETEGSGNAKAWAQGTTYSLSVDPTRSELKLHNYETNKDYDVSSIANHLNANDTEARYEIWGIPVTIQEVAAPEGFVYDTYGMDMYLCFVLDHEAAGSMDPDAENPTGHNDAYFVTTSGGNARPAELQAGTAYYVTYDGGSYGNTQYRIINYPELETLVRINKFGYIPDATTIGKTSDELNGMNIGRTPLGGVQMILYHYDEEEKTWRTWDYTANEPTSNRSQALFTLNDAGVYVFSKGLKAGSYFVTEMDLGSWSEEYENAYPDGVRGRYFSVGKTPVSITLYNPHKVSLALTKVDPTGNTALSGNTFTLTGGSSPLVKTTGADGSVLFGNIASGTYKLTETNAGKSTIYLTKYMEAQYPEYADLVNGKGLTIGYTYGTKDGDVVINAISFDDFEAELTIKNPDLVNLGLKKTNEENPDEVLPGAKFDVYFMPFTAWNGETKVNPDYTTAAWTKVNTSSLTTDAKGEIKLTNKDPGVYAFVETEAAPGYDIIRKTDGTPVVYYAVVRGGMDVTVSGLDANTDIQTVSSLLGKQDAAGEVSSVKTLFDEEVTISILNRPRATATATKAVKAGQIPATELTWKVELKVYDTINKTNLVGTATIQHKAGDEVSTTPVQFMNGNAPAYFSKGVTYYMEEVVTSDIPNAYEVNKVEKDATVIQPQTQQSTKFYPVQVEKDGDSFAVAVENQYMVGELTFAKRDGKQLSKLLSGASFVVKTVLEENGQEVEVPNATVTEKKGDDGKGTGIYVATIPLVDRESHEYYLYETTAPDGYVKEDGIVLTVELSAEENRKDWSTSMEEDQYVSNVEGMVLTLYKYANAKATDPVLAAAGDATFAVYHRQDNGIYEQLAAPKDIDADGKAEWLLTPGETYAFSEVSHAEKYASLESVWRMDGNAMTAMTPEEITVGAEKVNAFVIPEIQADFTYMIYNNPNLKVEVIKRDAGHYPEDVVPQAKFNIYEVDHVITDAAEVEELVANGTYLYQATTKVQSGTNVTHDIWEARDPAKYYLVVEVSVGATNYETYNNLNKDDNRVVWFVSLAPVTNPDPNVMEQVILDNVHGDATVSVTKVIEAIKPIDSTEWLTDGTDAVESLLTTGYDVRYVSTPVVESHNQSLTSFTLVENGLDFLPPASTAYEIKNIKIGPASHDTAYFMEEITNSAIDATVTWYDVDGNVISTSDVKDLSSAKSVTAPAGAASFTVDYFCEEVMTATEGKYALGNDFTPGPVEMEVRVDQQKDGTAQNPVTPIEKFTSKVDVELHHPVWNRDGSASPDKKLTASDTVEVNVKPLDFPIVAITKECNVDGHIVKLQKGTTITYFLTVSNTSETAAFVDPIILDPLPTGVTFKSMVGSVHGTKGEEFKTEVLRYTGDPTFSFESSSSSSVFYGDPETAVVFKLIGELQPGSSVTVTMICDVSDSVVIYDNAIYNWVFLSSGASTYHTVDNPKGYSFRLNETTFPADLDTEVKATGALTPMPQDVIEKRMGGLKDVLGSYYNEQYGWLKNGHIDQLNSYSSVTLVKANMGDQDSGFSSNETFIATATRNNSTHGDEVFDGWVDFRLVVQNGDNNDKLFLAIGDALPRVGDARGSKWDVVMDSITGVRLNGSVIDSSKYTVYYYMGSASTAKAAVADALEKTDSKYYVDGVAPALPSSWKLAADVAEEEMVNVTAFLMVFNPDPTLFLQSGKELIVTYHTLTRDMTDDEEFAKIAFEISYNSFSFHYAGALVTLNSNEVAQTITDGRVMVQGDLWIDEDWDSTQKSFTGENAPNRRDYSEYEIIKLLQKHIGFEIDDLRAVPGKTVTVDLDKPNTEVGEGIQHFSFEGLGAAYVVRENILYVDNQLNTAALRTTDPYNYRIRASLDNYGELRSIFTLTGKGADSYMSDNINEVANTSPNFWDSNFSGSNGSYVTDPFFLRFGRVDQTKDIGFRMERDLEIVKVAEDDSSVRIAGAEFTISGPFDEGAAAQGSTMKFVKNENGVYEPSENGSATLVTDENGKIKVTGLNWWKEYVITETKAGANYEMTATATAANGTAIEAFGDSGLSWTLKLPGTDRVTKLDSMTVTNKRSTTATIEAMKVVKDEFGSGISMSNLEGVFTFELYEIIPGSAPVLVDSAATDADGKVTFKEISYDKTGSRIYLIKEQIPADNDKVKGMTYSTEELTAVVTVDVGDEQKLISTVTYTDAEGKELATGELPAITNEYKPEPVSLSLYAEKVIQGAVPPTDKDFGFTLTAKNGAPMPAGVTGTSRNVVVHGEGSATFGEFSFDRAGTYQYTVKEYAVSGVDYTGYTFDPEEHAIEVIIGGSDEGKLTITVKMDGQEVAAEDGEYEIPRHNLAITNRYTPEEVTVVIPVTKVVTGTRRQAELKKYFEFALTADDADNPVPVRGATVYVTEGEKENLGPITFTEAGKFTYTVKETAGAFKADGTVDTAVGYTFDTTEYKAEVETRDVDGKLVATVTIYEDQEVYATWTTDGEASTIEALVFTNSYDPSDAEVTIKVKKEFDDESHDRPEKKTFTFTLTAVSEVAPLPEVSEITIEDAGEETFETITYDAVGTYVYKLEEVGQDLTGYVFDTTVYTITVVVTDNDGVLVAKTQVKVGDEVIKDFEESADSTVSIMETFTNGYIPEPGEIVLEAFKTLKNKRLKKDMFEFEVYEITGEVDEEGAPVEVLLQRVTNEANGSITFEPIHYTEPGTHTYKIVEVRGTMRRMTYDKSEFMVTVTVVDQDGKLVATKTDATIPTFKNKYKPNIPGTGYGADNDALLLTIGGLALATLLVALRKKKKSKAAK